MLKKLTIALLIALCAPMAALADMPGHHPRYLHALSDLRAARAYLERPQNYHNTNRVWDEQVAVREIDAALAEITNASVADGKNIYERPYVDVRMDYRGRLSRSLELLNRARNDISREEDNYWARGQRNRAIGHIDQASNFVRQGMAWRY